MFFAAFLAGAVLLSVFLLALTQVWTARVQAQTAADLAALAAGDLSSVSVFEAHPDASDACSQAQLVAEANNSTILRCWVQEGDAYVVVNHPIRTVIGSFSATAKARAGPSD